MQTILNRGQQDIAGLLSGGEPARAESRTGDRREPASRQASRSRQLTLPGNLAELSNIFAKTDASILSMLKRQQAVLGRNPISFLESLGAGSKARQIASAGVVGELTATVLKAVQSPEAQPIVRTLARQGRPFLAGRTAFQYLEVRLLRSPGTGVSFKKSPLQRFSAIIGFSSRGPC